MITESTPVCQCGYCQGAYVSSQGRERGAAITFIVIDEISNFDPSPEWVRKKEEELHKMRMKPRRRGRR